LISGVALHSPVDVEKGAGLASVVDLALGWVGCEEQVEAAVLGEWVGCEVQAVGAGWSLGARSRPQSSSIPEGLLKELKCSVESGWVRLL